jgi:recombinational DNA repair protein RecT
MDANVNQKPKMQITQILQETPPAQIAELDFVKDKYIANYNYCHKEKVGELMYFRQLVHFKQQITSNADLKSADPFSLYACFVTAAVNGYSMDPADNEVYLVALKGKAYLWRQAGAHVRRLMNSGQVMYADQAKLVYEGDDFEVVNGRVVKHVEKFQSEKYIAGYVRFVVDKKGNDKFFIYRKSDWEAWRKKSPQANGDNWSSNGQPAPGFLRTKIVKHAATEKTWATGNRPITEEFSVEVEEIEDIEHTEIKDEMVPLAVNDKGNLQSNVDDDSFVNTDKKDDQAGITHDDDDF